MGWDVQFDDEFVSWFGGLAEALQDEILAHVALLRERFEKEPPFRKRRGQVRLIHAPLQELPGEAVYDFMVSGLPLNNTGWALPARRLPPVDWRPTVTAPNVTGRLPNVLDNRSRIRLLQRSGFTMSRKV